MIVSPYSVATALALLSQGAVGNSFDQIKNVLHMYGRYGDIAAEYLAYHRMMVEQDAGNASLSVANQVFVQEQIPLYETFQEVAKEYFDAGIGLVDFRKPAEAAAKINHFVAEKTHDKIKELFDPSALSPASRVVLVNAIYMKAKWEHPFELYETYKQDFYSNENDKMSVDFMHATKRFNYAVLNDLHIHVIEMKYEDSDLSMLILLPDSRTGLVELDMQMHSYGLDNIFDQMEEKFVEVAIPKFKVEHTVKIIDVLKRVRFAYSAGNGCSKMHRFLIFNYSSNLDGNNRYF